MFNKRNNIKNNYNTKNNKNKFKKLNQEKTPKKIKKEKRPLNKIQLKKLNNNIWKNIKRRRNILGIKNKVHKLYRISWIMIIYMVILVIKELNKKLFMYQKKLKKQSHRIIEDIL